jgi:site-specific recombinase XerD
MLRGEQTGLRPALRVPANDGQLERLAEPIGRVPDPLTRPSVRLRRPRTMAKLRELMIRDTTLRGFAPNARRTYLRVVSRVARHYGRSPDRISNREVKAYLLPLHQNAKRSTGTCNVAAAALRFFYHNPLGRLHTDFPKHRVLFHVAYSTGMRVIVGLRPRDIDSGRMLIRVELLDSP